MTLDRARAFTRALTIAVLLPAIGAGGCVTASVEEKSQTWVSGRSGASSALLSTHGPRRVPGLPDPQRAPILLTAHSSAAPPNGAAGLCGRYPWACSSRGAARPVAETEILALARRINSEVNRKIRPATDRELYGRDEHWALPSSVGDCEDYALLKKKMLIEAGVPARNLFMATALNRRMEHHVVLVLRTSRNDLILDNLTHSIRPWQATGYTYLKRQNPGNKQKWEGVLLGPNASRA